MTNIVIQQNTEYTKIYNLHRQHQKCLSQQKHFVFEHFPHCRQNEFCFHRERKLITYICDQYRTNYQFVTFHRNILRTFRLRNEFSISIWLNSIVNCRISPDANNSFNFSCFFFLPLKISILKVVLNLTGSIVTKFNGLFE